MTKQIVHYDRSAGFKIKVGKSATVKPIDHPSSLVSNVRMTMTSTVVSYSSKTGRFETLNSIYVPGDYDNV